MSIIKTKELDQALQRKGFVKYEGSHHFYQLVDNEGKPTGIFTKISHSHKEIGDPLINAVRKDMHLSKSQLIEYAKCTLSQNEYYKILKDQNLI